MKQVVLITVFLLKTSALHAAEDVLLKCTFNGHSNGYDRFYLVETNAETVTLVDTDDAEVCSLTVKPHLFEWACDGTERRYPSIGKANRYTGEFETEWGNDPFGQYSQSNVFRVGTCVAQKADKLY